MKNLTWFLIDCLFPWPQPRSKLELELDEKRRQKQKSNNARLIEGLSGSESELTNSLAAVNELLSQENARKNSVDSRLSSIVGLSSIGGTIVVGAIVTPKPLQGKIGWLIMLFLLYLAVQLCCAIHGAILGLKRADYSAATPEDILPSGVATATHLRGQIKTSLEMLSDHRDANDSKVTMMAVAHRSMQNFIVGLLLLAVIGVFQSFAIKPTDSLVERLREDQELRELLRGPKGAPGPRGETGPQGSAGSCLTVPQVNQATPVPKK